MRDSSETPPVSRLARVVASAYPATFVGLILFLLASSVAVPGIAPWNYEKEFRFHHQLVSAYTQFRYWAGDHVYNQSVLGKDGWIFHTGDLSLRDYQRTRKVAKTDLRKFHRGLVELDSELAADGATLLIVVVPNKPSIYPQYMPDEIPVIGTQSPLDQVLAYMSSVGGAPILDLRPALVREAANRQLYYTSDTHWNALGAYFSYVAIVNALSADYPGLEPRPLSDFSLKTIPDSRVTDLPRVMGHLPIRDDEVLLKPKFPNTTSTTKEKLSNGLGVYVTVGQNEQLPELLYVGDSFYWGIEQFLPLGFSRVNSGGISFHQGPGPAQPDSLDTAGCRYRGMRRALPGRALSAFENAPSDELMVIRVAWLSPPRARRSAGCP